LSQLLAPELVALQLKARTSAEAILETARPLEANPAVSDFAAFHQAILEREAVSPTALGNGIALPHARTSHVRKVVIAAGRSEEGIWFENSQQQVRLIFVIGTPTELVREYLSLVGLLTRLLRQPAVRERLLSAKSPAEFLAPLT
jgi:mannitol/fructose-specific phosphotransferase system IIA component (Ntr-type)